MESALDSATLTAHDSAQADTSAYEAPQGELEQAIAQLWRGVFHLDRIGRHDNFFELGGNSLLGMDLSEMFATSLGLEVPVLTLFQCPTIAEIAREIASF